jgi:hypothetical protein
MRPLQLLLITSSILGPNTLLSTLFSDIPKLCFLLMWNTVFHTHTKQEKLLNRFVLKRHSFYICRKLPNAATNDTVFGASQFSNLGRLTVT